MHPSKNMKRAEIPAPKERITVRSYDKIPDPPAEGAIIKVRLILVTAGLLLPRSRCESLEFF